MTMTISKSNTGCARDRKSAGTLYPTTSTILISISIIQLILSTPLVHCQDFEDLNNKQQQNPFPASFSRQPGAGGGSGVAAGSRQRPLLTNRISAGSANGQQQLVAQATNNAAPSSSSSSLQPQVQSTGSTSNIEQMMKNALARTSQLNAAAAVAADPRLDSSPSVPALESQQQSRASPSGAAGPVATSPAASTGTGTGTSGSQDRRADSSEFGRSTVAAESASDDNEKQTTQPANSADTTSGHETVYGDQRFANLFARRNNARKAAKFQPSEPAKAKPTLPSFIKSPPDPKQFSAAAAQAFSDGVPGTRGTGATLLQNSQRQQQQQQNRANLLAGQQKKPIINSNSAASANNKRVSAAASASRVASSGSPVGPKAAVSNAKPLVTSKPAAATSNNNPFNNRNQSANSQDPASVIAMARKRLLANNALESAKLKQQQAAKPVAN